MKYSIKRFIRFVFLPGILVLALNSVQGQTRQIRLGDNMGDHTASQDLDMNSKKLLNAEGIAIGTATIGNQSIALQVDGANKAILIPRITSLAAIVTPENGMLVYNAGDNKFYVRQNGAWVTFASSSGSVISVNDKFGSIIISGDGTTVSVNNSGTNIVLSANNNSAIWNADRLQGNVISATSPVAGQVLSWNGTSWVPANVTATTAGTVTTAAQPAITSVGTLSGLTVTAPIAGAITGNAATATKLAAPKNINGVAFDGSSDITISAAADAATLTGTTLNPAIVNSSLTSVGTLGNLTVTNPIAGSITGNAATATTAASATTAGTVTTAAQPAITSVGTLSGLTVTAPIAGAITGNAATATKLAAPKNINGVAFDGSSDITISAAADAATLTGTTLNPAIVNSSLTSVGTLGNLTVTNPIAGSITGNAGTATTAATVTTAAQPAITSVGTLTGLTVTAPIAGDITGSAAKLTTARTINGVSFDGTSNINVTATADAGSLTGATLAANVLSSSLTSVGTLANLTVTNPIAGSITGNAATATTATTATTAGTVTTAAQPAITSVGTLTGLTVSAPITGSVSGNAGTATALATARTINGVSFDGTSNINVTATADAGSLTGATLAANVLSSSLTSVGTLGNLTVTNPIAGSVTGSAATVTTAAQPAITSVGTLTGLTVSAPITGSVTGNAGTATALATARTINGVSFDGTSNINVTATADAGSLTGATLNASVVNS
ncbi:beta strand repeat-containing protein, partial [Daejeonella rubra]